METTKKKRTREEVRAAFREYLDDKKVPYDTHDSSKPMTDVKDG